MDALEQRTLYVGLIIGLAAYAVGFVMPFLIEGDVGQWVSLGFTAVALLFVGVWFVAVKRGFRIGGATRVEQRAKEKRRKEREKLQHLRR